MDLPRFELDLPPTWRDALAEAAARRRAVVLGATNVGKSTFIRALLDGPGEGMRLIDLDPGQKMIGPPGTASLGRLDEVERFIFLGTTSASALSAIAGAARALAEGVEPFVVNTSGFVTGLGARLQAMTVAAIRADLIVEIGPGPIVAPPEGVELIRLPPSPHARRKTAGVRNALRRAAFEREIADASLLRLPLERTAIHPGLPSPWETPARPVCSLADEEGEDLALGIVEDVDLETLLVSARAPAERVRLVRLGKMWAEPKEGRWRLVERLSPSWAAP